jgi:hypothetical protein
MNKICVVSVLAGLLACGSPSKPEPGTAKPPISAGDGHESHERPEMTVEECSAQGTVVGDIGDGAVHRPDYLCPNGEPPIGTVPQGIEGSVCCRN